MDNFNTKPEDKCSDHHSEPEQPAILETQDGGEVVQTFLNPAEEDEEEVEQYVFSKNAKPLDLEDIATVQSVKEELEQIYEEALRNEE